VEFIVQLFRALACRARIRLLRLMVVFGEMYVSDLARATSLEISLVSAHLKVLAAAGVVWRRRSGRRIAYRLAESAGNPVTARVLGVLTGLFGSIAQADPKQVAEAEQADAASHSDGALFACFTAFTHPRRLQVIRYLGKHGTASMRELAEALSMSIPACVRHLDKLERRGVVCRKLPRSRSAYRLAEGREPVMRDLLGTVLSYVARAGR